MKASTSHSDGSCPPLQPSPDLEPDVEWVGVPGFQQTPAWGSSPLPRPDSQWAWSLLPMGLPGWPFMALGGLPPAGPRRAPESAPASRDWAFAIPSLPLSLPQGCPFRGAESGHRVPAGPSHHSGVSAVLLAVPPSWGAGKTLRLLGRGPPPVPTRQQSQWPRSGLTPHPLPPHPSRARLVDLTASSLAKLFPNDVHVFLIARR